ncbi:hypothetical protein V491_06042 [Pseudogymnoascus sp. VKM F-3775]|nr:hypothetical protein V491_06042 [Pseudogymnoascus sp. VKM F-3775]
MTDSSLSDREKPYQDVVHTEHLESGVITNSALVNDEGQWDGPDADFSGIDKATVLRKMDFRLIPVLALLYLLSFLDRGNIGNANIQGLSEDLRLTDTQYALCLTVFFFTYALFELPSNLLLKKLRPSVWLPSIMVAWGTCTICLGVTNNYAGRLSVRVFLGLAEAGLFPGVSYYLTMWYCSEELAIRQGLFFSAASMAGAFSGLLAFAIAKMDGVGGYEGWRWIFILEGLLTVLVACVAYFIMYDFPDTASFLTPQERAWASHRLKYQGSKRSGRMIAESDKFEWRFVKAAVLDWQVWLGTMMFIGIVCPLYSISLFLPTIINQLGYQAATAQLLTIPIYITAAIMCIGTSKLSDRAAKAGNSRWPYIFWPMIAILVGFIIALAASAHGGVPGVVYAGVFITTCGIYPAVPGNITWIANNLAGSYKRAAGMGFQIGIGNLSGAMASNFYRKRDKPQFILGHALNIGIVSLGIAAVMTLRWNYARINAQRERDGSDGGDISDDEIAKMGDRAPTFRYTL